MQTFIDDRHARMPFYLLKLPAWFKMQNMKNLRRAVAVLFFTFVLMAGTLIFGACNIGSANIDGLYYMIFSVELINGSPAFLSAGDSRLNYERYVKIDGLKTEVYNFVSDSFETKTLISYTKKIYARKESMPSFDVMSDKGEKIYTEYTDMNPEENKNPSKQLFKQYIKVDSDNIPNFYQSALLGRFGYYELTGSSATNAGSPGPASEANKLISINGTFDKCRKETINGRVTAVAEQTYTYFSHADGFWFFKMGSEQIKFNFADDKLRVYNDVLADAGYKEYTKAAVL